MELHDAHTHTQGRLTGMPCAQLALGVTAMPMRSMQVSAGLSYVHLDQLCKNDQIHLFHGHTAKLVEGFIQPAECTFVPGLAASA